MRASKQERTAYDPAHRRLAPLCALDVCGALDTVPVLARSSEKRPAPPSEH